MFVRVPRLFVRNQGGKILLVECLTNFCVIELISVQKPKFKWRFGKCKLSRRKRINNKLRTHHWLIWIINYQKTSILQERSFARSLEEHSPICIFTLGKMKSVLVVLQYWMNVPICMMLVADDKLAYKYRTVFGSIFIRYFEKSTSQLNFINNQPTNKVKMRTFIAGTIIALIATFGVGKWCWRRLVVSFAELGSWPVEPTFWLAESRDDRKTSC